jgi:tetratricopeptide (TPR) repeat protein
LIALPLPAMADPSELLWRGVALAKTGNCAQAIPSLERGMKADELVPKFWLDVCYASEGQRAIVLLSQQGNTTALHRLRGDMMLVLRGDAAGAVPEYAEALKLEPRNPHLLEKQAEAYRTLGDTKQAETFARAALDVDAHEFSALQTLAQIAMKDRSYAEALVRLKQLMAIDPNDAWTQVELGVAYGQLGQPEEALRHLEPPLASGYPDNKGAFHAQLASVLRKLGCENDAKQAAAEAERLANAAFHGVEPGSSDAH